MVLLWFAIVLIAATTLLHMAKSPLLSSSPEWMSERTTKSAEKANTTATAAAAATRTGTVFYHTRPEDFVGIVADCAFDDWCGLLYQHVPKSGGSTFEAYFFGMFPPDTEGTGLSEHLVMRTRFQNSMFWIDKNEKTGRTNDVSASNARIEPYCGRSKFTSYQDQSRGYADIVQACLDGTKTTKRKFVSISSYREPISRTLSVIHQWCNKNFGAQTEKMKRACRRCSYPDPVVDQAGMDDKAVWDGVANMTIRSFEYLRWINEHMKDELRYNRIVNDDETNDDDDVDDGDGDDRRQSVDVLMIDTMDLDSFFSAFDAALVRHPLNQKKTDNSNNNDNNNNNNNNNEDNNNEDQNGEDEGEENDNQENEEQNEGDQTTKSTN